MAYGNYGKSRGKSKRTSVRLTGLFKTKKRGMYVGSVSELDDMVAKIKAAMKAEKGLVFFLFKNDEEEEGPLFTLYMDVSQDESERRPSKRKPIEDDDPEEEEEDKQEVPF